MIELTEEQLLALEKLGGDPPQFLNPRTNETFVMLSLSDYERLMGEDYEDSPWTREELQAVAWEVVRDEDWEEFEGPGEASDGS